MLSTFDHVLTLIADAEERRMDLRRCDDVDM
jgi:hypothetical protein